MLNRLWEVKTYTLRAVAIIATAFILVSIVHFLPSAKPVSHDMGIEDGDPAQYNQSNVFDLETLLLSQHRHKSPILPLPISALPPILHFENMPSSVSIAAKQQRINFILNHSVNLTGQPEAAKVESQRGEIILSH